ncbi:type III pantothenate kinase [Thalassotalea ganghwensis]
MQILLDIGNTRSKYLSVILEQRSAINVCLTLDITPEWLTHNFSQAEQIIIASVGSEKLSEMIRDWCQQHNIGFRLLTTEAQRFGIQCAYQEPEKLGVDRWLVILAAAQLYPQQHCIIVDAGTATTIDVVDSSGLHRGGWILPGIDLLQNALVTQTQRIDAQPLEKASVELGKNTHECVNHGAWVATTATIEYLIDQLNTNQTAVNLILTGGNADQLSRFIQQPYSLVDDLIFIGMQRFISEQR